MSISPLSRHCRASCSSRSHGHNYFINAGSACRFDFATMGSYFGL